MTAMIHVKVDDTWHVQHEDRTNCNHTVPFGSEWTHDEPSDDLCGECYPAPEMQPIAAEDEERLGSLKKDELKARATALGLESDGTKAELIERLENAPDDILQPEPTTTILPPPDEAA